MDDMCATSKSRNYPGFISMVADLIQLLSHLIFSYVCAQTQDIVLALEHQPAYTRKQTVVAHQTDCQLLFSIELLHFKHAFSR
jgi:hypothetical protein